jgi:hypothetical protein
MVCSPLFRFSDGLAHLNFTRGDPDTSHKSQGGEAGPAVFRDSTQRASFSRIFHQSACPLIVLRVALNGSAHSSSWIPLRNNSNLHGMRRTAPPRNSLKSLKTLPSTVTRSTLPFPSCTRHTMRSKRLTLQPKGRSRLSVMHTTRSPNSFHNQLPGCKT